MDQNSDQLNPKTNHQAAPEAHIENSQSNSAPAGPPGTQGQGVLRVWYLAEYQGSLKSYSEDPSEQRQGRIWVLLFLLASIIGAIVLGANGGLKGVRGIVCWEIIAIVDTTLFAIMYFADLWNEAKKQSLTFGPSTLLTGFIIALNFIFLGAAIVILLYSERSLSSSKAENEIFVPGFSWLYVGYLLFLIMSFLMFTRLDYVFARDSKVFKKTREYWAYCLFVDAPATIAFIILLVYLLVIHKVGTMTNLDIISGAVVMQMLIADTLYLVIASNFHLWLLANRLSKGCNQ